MDDVTMAPKVVSMITVVEMNAPGLTGYMNWSIVDITVMPELGGPGGHWPPPPIFSRSVNPILTGGGQIIPTYYNCPPPKFFHLPALLYILHTK